MRKTDFSSCFSLNAGYLRPCAELASPLFLIRRKRGRILHIKDNKILYKKNKPTRYRSPFC